MRRHFVRWILTGAVLLIAMSSGLAWTMVNTSALHSSVIAYTQLTGQASSTRVSMRLIDVRTRLQFAPHPEPDALNISMDWSPSGDQLAYVAVGRLGVLPAMYTIRPDGTDQQVIMDVLSSFLTLRWSPDGRFLIFVEFQGATSILQVVDVETRWTRPLLDLNVIPSDPPDWSPDGEFIVYLHGETLGDYALVTVDVLTGRQEVLDSERSVFRVRWSPDGQAIAYAQRGDIYVMQLADESVRRLTTDQPIPDTGGRILWRPE